MVITDKYGVPKTDPTIFSYIITTPDDFDPARDRLPMIVFLHGSGERGDNIELVKIHGVSKHFAAMGDKRSCITLSPQCPFDETWNMHIKELKSLIDYIADKYNADKNRISCTGLSMGGFGAWEIAMEYPGYFSAVAPVCGGGMEWRASLIGNTPVWAFHGEDDDTVPVGRTKDMVKTLKAAGGNVKITLYPGVGHNCWDNAYDKEELIDWLLSQSKLI